MRFRSALARPARVLAAILAILAIAFTASAQSSPRPAPPIPARLAAPASLRPRANSTQPLVATPVFSVPPGSYSGPQTVTVTDATPGVTMYYTTNGTWPTTSSPKYNGSITISRSCTLVVLATLSGYQSNDVWAAYYITSVPDSFVYSVAGASGGYAGNGGPATQAGLNQPNSTATDGSGNLYIADTGNNVIRKVDASTGIITTVAGTGAAGYSGDSGPATAAQLNQPNSLAFDSAGNLYISEKQNNDVRKITMSTGAISTFAGSQSPNGLGDGGPATSASVYQPSSIAIDGSDHLYILCGGIISGRVREVDANTQNITTVAGGGSNLATLGGLATSVHLPAPQKIAVDAAANVYITDNVNVVWKITRSSGNIGLFAGAYNFGGYSGDGGPATSAKLSLPVGIAVDSKGNVYISDTFNSVFRKVDTSTGVISTVAGNASPCFAFVEEASAALSSEFCFAQEIHFDRAGNLYYSSGDSVFELTAVGTPPSTPTPDPALSLAAGAYSSPQSLSISNTAIGASTYLWLVTNPPSSYEISPKDIFLGENAFYAPIGVAGPATVFAQAVAPGHIPSNVVSAAYTYSVPPASLVTTVAGGGKNGFSAQGGPATSAEIGSAGGIAMDSVGNIFIADPLYNVVWEVDTSGIISIVAGTGKPGYTGDNGPATSATFNIPSAVVVDRNGNIFIADMYNDVVREVLASNGNVVTYAGNGQTGSNPAGGGPATSTSIWVPSALALDSNSNLYIIAGLNLVYEVNASTGIIQIVAGNTVDSGLGDGGPATSAWLNNPQGLALDSSDNLYIADNGDSRVREVNAKTSIINTVAGDGTPGFGSAGLATAVPLNPQSIALDPNGNLIISTGYDVRKVDAKTNMISTIAGIDYSGDKFDPESASMTIACPGGILSDSQSNIYFSDGCVDTVRKITVNAPAPAPTFDPPAGAYTSPQSVTISDTAPNSTIYYTIDGSTPTNKSTQFNGAINVTANQTINAIAVAAGYGQSSVGSATYTFLATPTITWSAPAAITYGTALGSAQLNATASVPGAFVYLPAAGAVLPVGSQTLSVTFTPTDTADYATATDSVMLTVNPAMPAIALASSTNPSVVAQSVTFTATLSSPAGTPTGSVTFYDGTTSLGSGTLASGVATYTTTALAAGAHSITAQYSGDANFAPVTSTALNQTVNTFSIGPAPGAPTTASGAPGSIATYVLTVTPPAASPVTFSVTGLPAGFSSSFSPGSVAAGAGATQVELTINIPTQAAAAQVPATPGSASRLPLAFGLVLLPLLGLGKQIRGSRFLILAALAIAGVVASAALSGCSHNFNINGSTGTSTPPGTYTLTVTTTAGAQTQSTSLTLNVQ